MKHEKHIILSPEEVAAMHQALAQDQQLQEMTHRQGDPEALYEDYRHRMKESEALWKREQENLEPLKQTGTTRRFEMLPLVDWFTSGEGLMGEAGVSYLIRTDEATILFDLGLNKTDSHPSPLLSNMEKLGLPLSDIDIIVISHHHSDHVGGKRWKTAGTFSLSGQQQDLGEVKVYTPAEMSYPGLEPVFTPQPRKIAEGVATTGVLNSPMFHGDTAEQALIINVEDFGLVVISGCGHPGIEKIVVRAQTLLEEPVRALLGGFHLPVTTGRNITPDFRFTVAGKLPWEPLTIGDLEQKISFLKEHGVQQVGISPHDSCDTTIDTFRKAFQQDYEDLVVGRNITLKE